MSSKRFCDRCKKEIDPQDRPCEVKVWVTPYNEVTMDFCEKCSASLVKIAKEIVNE